MSIFTGITWVDYLDIILVSVLIYQFLRIIRGTRAMQMLWGLVLILLMSLVSRGLEFHLMTWMLNLFVESFFRESLSTSINFSLTTFPCGREIGHFI